MKILRTDAKEQSQKVFQNQIYVRRDLTIVMANEAFYQFVGGNSYLPFSALIAPEDGKLLLEQAQGELEEPLEMVTLMHNGNEEEKDLARPIHLVLESSDRTEKGEKLLRLTFFDIWNLENRGIYVENHLAKYRHMLGLINQYYFEYDIDGDAMVIYKYFNEKSQQIWKGSLDRLREGWLSGIEGGRAAEPQLEAFCNKLKSGRSFSLDIPILGGEKDSECHAAGGTLVANSRMMVGLLMPDQMSAREQYYLTPAARDAGTGLLNKKAVMEYTLDQLRLEDGATRWFIMIDIDNFKNINDGFGHLFGDEVIRSVAEALQTTVGGRGTVGRFGGDEFFVMVDKIPTREEIKVLLKTVTKKLYYEYDPKLNITCSIGVTMYPKDGTSYEELMDKADKCLYIAKEKGKNRHIIYDEKLHGGYHKEDTRVGAVTYTVSEEKRRMAVSAILSGICTQGVDYLVKDEKVQKNFRELFDLDGFTIFAEGGETVLCRSGNYAKPVGDMGKKMFEDEEYLRLFDESGMFVVSTMTKVKAMNPKAHQVMTDMEIGASVQCLAYRDGVPCVLIHFDMFNRNRKWMDLERELLSILGGCIGQLLCR